MKFGHVFYPFPYLICNPRYSLFAKKHQIWAIVCEFARPYSRRVHCSHFVHFWAPDMGGVKYQLLISPCRVLGTPLDGTRYVATFSTFRPTRRQLRVPVVALC